MSYFSVGNVDDTLSVYVWADNAQHAYRKAEDILGPIAPQRQRIKAVRVEDIADVEYVIDEPEEEAEARLDWQED